MFYFQAIFGMSRISRAAVSSTLYLFQELERKKSDPMAVQRGSLMWSHPDA